VRPKAKVLIIIGVSVIAGLFVSNRLKSTDSYMLSLPVYKHFKCTICHESPQPTSGADLNSFGMDYKKNGYIWDRTLADKDSDGDGFANGIELGDDNGDGIPEISIERSNPGDRLDTPNSVDKETWGLIKSLFQDSN